MAKIRNGESYLDTHLSANDYYSEKESVAGLWVGRGAELLRIEGNSISKKDKAFEFLRNNQHPVTGEKLTIRNKTTRLPTFDEARKSLCQKLRVNGDLKTDVLMPSTDAIEEYRSKMKPICNRVAFFDFQCGCSKSVSIIALVAGDHRLRIAHEESVAVGLRELESLAARRIDVMGKKHLQFTGNIAAAIFEHDCSRALDPQLHTHCVVANATFDEGKQEWVALSEFEMIKAIRYAGKVYQNELASRVKALGYDIVEKRNERGMIEGFEIKGVTDEVMKLYSKRRAVIEKEIEAFKKKVGRFPSPAEISILTRESRESKKLTKITTEEVREKQKAQLPVSEFYKLSFLMVSAFKKIEAMKEDDFQKRVSQKEGIALEGAAKHLFERSSTLPTHKLLAEALNQQLGSLELSELKNTLNKAALVQLVDDPNPLASLYTSKEHLEHEEWAVNFVDALSGKKPKLLDTEPVTSEWLAKEQSDAVKFVCGMEDAVCAIRGIAGAGKTTMLKELHEHLDQAGHRMLYLAPTASAVNVLKSEGFLNAMTVSEYLTKAASETSWHKAVIVIDESGLKSTKQGYEALKIAHQHWQRVVLVGDSKQHVSVEAGDFLRLLETHSKMKSNVLKEIKRQIPEEYREAIGLMAQGRAGEALEEFDQMGCINEGGAKYIENAAQDYLVRSELGAKANEVIAVAPTWEENFAFTDVIRDGLKAHGTLKEGVALDVVSSMQWTRWQREQASNYKEGYVITPNKKVGGLEKRVSYVVEKIEVGEHGGTVVLQGGRQLPLKQAKFFDVGLKRKVECSEGDLLLLQANDKQLGLINGKVVTVERVENDGSVRTREGVTIPSGYRQFTHGYVVTSHKSQGRTANHVVIAAEKLDEKAAYVSTSRGRESCDIHTPEKERLIAGARVSSLRVGVFDGRAPSYQKSFGANKKTVLLKNGIVKTEKKVEGQIIINDNFFSQSLASPAENSRSPKLRSMHPMRNQSVRVNSFGKKLSLKVAKIINVAKKVRNHILPISIRQNITQQSSSQSLHI